MMMNLNILSFAPCARSWKSMAMLARRLLTSCAWYVGFNLALINLKLRVPLKILDKDPKKRPNWDKIKAHAWFRLM